MLQPRLESEPFRLTVLSSDSGTETLHQIELRADTRRPAAFLARYPRPGMGILNLRQSFPIATSDTPYFSATLVAGPSQTSAYSSSRFQ